MDEMAVDVTNWDKIKVLIGQNEMCCFLKTPEGDKKMNHHITMCITSRADGKIPSSDHKKLDCSSNCFIFVASLFTIRHVSQPM